MDTVHANFQNVNELYDYGIINSEPSIIHIDIYSRIASGDQRGLISVSKKLTIRGYSITKFKSAHNVANIHCISYNTCR